MVIYYSRVIDTAPFKLPWYLRYTVVQEQSFLVVSSPSPCENTQHGNDRAVYPLLLSPATTHTHTERDCLVSFLDIKYDLCFQILVQLVRLRQEAMNKTVTIATFWFAFTKNLDFCRQLFRYIAPYAG
jgi:hypothetical protein